MTKKLTIDAFLLSLQCKVRNKISATQILSVVFCWYLGGYIYTNRAWLFATPYYIFAWLVHLRGYSCPSCTNRTNKRTSQTTKHTSCLVGALETSAPPESTP